MLGRQAEEHGLVRPNSVIRVPRRQAGVGVLGEVRGGEWSLIRTIAARMRSQVLIIVSV